MYAKGLRLVLHRIGQSMSMWSNATSTSENVGAGPTFSGAVELIDCLLILQLVVN